MTETLTSRTGATGGVTAGVIGGKDHYLADFAELGDRLPGSGLAWLGELRQAGIARFAELDFPTPRHEDWKYTNVAPLTRIAFKPASVDGHAGRRFGTAGRALALPAPFAAAGFIQLVFVDGRFAPEHSEPGSLPEGVRATSLKEALDLDPSLLREHLGRYADGEKHSFTALNSAFWSDGAFIHLPDSTRIETPVHLVFLTTGGSDAEPMVSHLRNLVLAGAGSSVTIVEHYLGLDAAGGRETFTNAVTEVVAAPSASVTHYKLQQESEAAYHVGMLQARQDRDSTFTSHSLALGARLSRTEIRTLLDAEGASCVLNGLYLAHGRQHVDHQTLIDHAKPHCSSQELYKGILAGSARGVFTGRIIVREDAQKTTAHQTNRNLILSDQALADTRPQLEIRANDVVCTHGAAIGRLDEDMIFYLRARGIAETEARALLTRAFANEVLKSVRIDAIRTALDEILTRWLPGKPQAGAGVE